MLYRHYEVPPLLHFCSFTLSNATSSYQCTTVFQIGTKFPRSKEISNVAVSESDVSSWMFVLLHDSLVVFPSSLSWPLNVASTVAFKSPGCGLHVHRHPNVTTLSFCSTCLFTHIHIHTDGKV